MGLGYLRLREGERGREGKRRERDLITYDPWFVEVFQMNSEEGRDEEEPVHSVPLGKFLMHLIH